MQPFAARFFNVSGLTLQASVLSKLRFFTPSSMHAQVTPPVAGVHSRRWVPPAQSLYVDAHPARTFSVSLPQMMASFGGHAVAPIASATASTVIRVLTSLSIPGAGQATLALMDDEDEGNWVEVRRASHVAEADMVRDFLLEHGVRSAVNGNAAGMQLAYTVTDIRIVVSPKDVENAREVLAAMVAETNEHPFRGAPPPPKDDEEPYVAKRSILAAGMLAFLIPIGAGHFYARHGAAGTILCAGIVGSFLGLLLGHYELMVSFAIIVAVDFLGSFWAVKRFNEQRVPPENVQRNWAIGAVVLAFAVAFFAGSR